MVWERDKEFGVVVIPFVKEQPVSFLLDALNLLIICLLSEHIKCHLRSFTSPMKNLSRLVGFACEFVSAPVCLLARSVTIDGLDEAGAGRVWGTVAARTDSRGGVFAAEGTFLAVVR